VRERESKCNAGSVSVDDSLRSCEDVEKSGSEMMVFRSEGEARAAGNVIKDLY